MAIPGLINYTPPTNQVAPALATTTTLPAVATYNPATAVAAKAGTASWQVDTPQTVAGQVKNIIDTNSPLMQQAETSAKQAANSRGLLNSSLAVGAGQDAVIRAALPIAQQDAGTFANSAQYNADTTNTANRFNASNEQQVGLINAEAQNQAGQFGAQQKNAMATTQAQLEADTNRLNVQQANTMVINQLDQANKIQLADIQATYQNQMQANQGSSALFDQTMAAINNIQQSTTMDAATKQASTDQQVQLLKAGLSLQGSIANLNLTDVLNFNVGQTPAATTASSTTPATPATTQPAQNIAQLQANVAAAQQAYDRAQNSNNGSVVNRATGNLNAAIAALRAAGG